MRNALLSPAEAGRRIHEGRTLVIAGSEQALRSLPKGNWIGGTTVYFMTQAGATIDPTRVFVTEYEPALNMRIESYDVAHVPDFAVGREGRGCTVLLIPGYGQAHRRFGLEAPHYWGLFDQPVAGWIAGVPLDKLGVEKPMVVNGLTGECIRDGAVALHMSFSDESAVAVDIVNPFEADPASPELIFPTAGFQADTVRIDGQSVLFSDWLNERGIGPENPLVANFAGSAINVSFGVIEPGGPVNFHAPIMPDVVYRLARPSVAKARGEVAGLDASGRLIGSADLSFNCILNFLNGTLDDAVPGGYEGPITFGEIAYVLMNQTLVHMRLETEVIEQAA